MANRAIEKRYARALFRLGKHDTETGKKWLNDLRPLEELFAVASAKQVLCSPVMPVDLKNQLLDYALSKSQVDAVVKRFIHALSGAGRIALIPGILNSFRSLLAKKEGVIKAQVTAAVPLGDAQEQSLREAIGKDRRVEMEVTTDSRLLGGMVVRIGNAIIDLSLKTKLNRIAQEATGLQDIR